MKASLPELLINGPGRTNCTMVLAHGAGAPMDTEFMNAFAESLADRGLRVVRFEFPYMAERRRSGKRRAPDRAPILLETWLQVVDSLHVDTLVIGGKSMGGRIASLIADDAGVSGLVCLGYPFHPAGKPDRLRVDHLETIHTPTLIIQGERDSLGNKEEVSGYDLSSEIEIRWVPDGDHSFKPRKASGRTAGENWQDGVEAVDAFVKSLSVSTSRGTSVTPPGR
jgi:predicted alpha/beta-hydrolase family hydrolase